MLKKWWQITKSSNFWIKLTHWEYWPMEIVNIPVIIIWLCYALRAKDLFFFSNTNPNIKNGGVLGESKWRIYQLLPAQYLPKMFLINPEELAVSMVQRKMEQMHINFPIVIKPDVGERGYLVEKISTRSELEDYLQRVPKIKFIFQEYINYPVELSIMYHRFPNAKNGQITSLCIKEMLTVIGDGSSTLSQLIHSYPRARIQLKSLTKRFDNMEMVVPKNKKMELIPIGNHCRGAKFCNGNHLIDIELTETVDTISNQTEGIFYGRFDIRCQSLDAIKKGQDFTILEYNGVASEPAHIYHPGYSIIQAYRDWYYHWGIIYRLHKSLKNQGYSTMSWNQAKEDLFEYRKYKRLEFKRYG